METEQPAVRGFDVQAPGGERVSRRAALRSAGIVGGLAALAWASDPAGAASSSDCSCDQSNSGESCGCAEQEPIVPTATLDRLPDTAPEQAGRLRMLTDYDRGLWLDTGERWVSVRNHVFDVRAFGAVGDGKTDDWPAFSAALEAMRSWIGADSTSADGHTLFVPPGTYRLAQSLVINRAITVTGAGGAGSSADAVLRFDTGLAGVVIEGAQPGLTGSPGRAGAGTVVERLRIETNAAEAPAAGNDQSVPTYGVWLRTRAHLRGLAVAGFAADGIRVEGTSGASADDLAGWSIDGCIVSGCGGHGLGVSRASGGMCSGLIATDNGNVGIADDSATGNTYVRCSASGNQRGAYDATGAGNRSLFLGCGSTADQAASTFAAGVQVVGGDHGAGFSGGNAWTADGSRVLLQAQTSTAAGDGKPATAPTLSLHGASGQTQPHLAVSGSDGTPHAQLDATGRFLLGDGRAIQPGDADALVTLIGNATPAAIRWDVPGEENDPSFVGQIRAVRGSGGSDNPANTGAWLAVDSTDAAGGPAETLVLREGRVGIGTSAPTPAAILELASTGQVFLPPRMTSEQRDAIASPPEGGMLYNLTTHRLNVFDGDAWQEVAFSPTENGG